MDLARLVQLLVIVALGLAGAVKAFDIKGSRTLRTLDGKLSALLSLGFLALASGQFLSLPLMVRELDSTTSTGVTKTSYNTLVVLGLAFLLAFFTLTSDLPSRRRTRRLLLNSALAIITILTLVILMALTPTSERSHSVPEPGRDTWFALSFYVVGNLWFLYSYGQCCWYSSRYARRTSGTLATASIVISLGFLASATTSVVRLIVVSLREAGVSAPEVTALNSINFGVNSVGLSFCSIGLCMLGAWRLLERRRKRRYFRELAPLWERLHASIPNLASHAPESSSSPTAFGGGFDRRYTQRILDCWDGIMRVAPALNRAIVEARGGKITPAFVATALADATTTSPPMFSERAESPSVELLDLLTQGADRGAETGVEVLAAVSRALVGTAGVCSNTPVTSRKSHINDHG